jgi:uncharacterized membrane protein
MSEAVTNFAETIGRLLDVAGVLAISIGFVLSVAVVVPALRRGERIRAYGTFRVGLARAIVLGLEVLVAADIIRTVAVEPTLENVTVLAIIVLVRTVLSFTLMVEIEGRWPWQPKPPGAHESIGPE